MKKRGTSNCEKESNVNIRNEKYCIGNE